MAFLRFFARIAYVPTMMIGLNGVAVILVASGYSYAWVALLFVLAISLSLLMEWVLPYEQAWNQSHDDTDKDIAHGVIYEVANIMAILVLPLVAMFVPWRSIWPTSLPIGLQLLLAVVIADFCMTMIHYVSHRVSWLWRLHAIHHSVHRLYGFNGLVRHPLHQMLDLLAGTLPLVLAGLPVSVAVLLGFAISVQLLVQHSNVDYRLGPLQPCLAVGPVHRLHHVNWCGAGDVNFGLFFTFWDRLLGTLWLDTERAPRVGDIGLEGGSYFPQSYVQQLLQPFKNDQLEDTAQSQGSNARDRPNPRAASRHELKLFLDT